MEKIEIGKIVKEQGIKGDVKVIVFADDNFDFSTLKTVYVKGIEAKVERVYKLSGGIGVKLDIIDSRNTASLYKNTSIFANREDLKCPDNRYFVADLLNKQVVLDTQEKIGKLVDVQNFGSADIFYVKTEQKQVLISHIDGLIESVDGDKVVLNAQKFRQVAIYED